jgi:hypothetical protein
MPKSEKNTYKKSTGDAKSAVDKQPTSTTKASVERISVPRILSWLCAANATLKSRQTERGPKKKAI